MRLGYTYTEPFYRLSCQGSLSVFFSIHYNENIKGSCFEMKIFPISRKAPEMSLTFKAKLVFGRVCETETVITKTKTLLTKFKWGDAYLSYNHGCQDIAVIETIKKKLR